MEEETKGLLTLIELEYVHQMIVLFIPSHLSSVNRVIQRKSMINFSLSNSHSPSLWTNRRRKTGGIARPTRKR